MTDQSLVDLMSHNHNNDESSPPPPPPEGEETATATTTTTATATVTTGQPQEEVDLLGFHDNLPPTTTATLAGQVLVSPPSDFDVFAAPTVPDNNNNHTSTEPVVVISSHENGNYNNDKDDNDEIIINNNNTTTKDKSPQEQQQEQVESTPEPIEQPPQEPSEPSLPQSESSKEVKATRSPTPTNNSNNNNEDEDEDEETGTKPNDPEPSKEDAVTPTAIHTQEEESSTEQPASSESSPAVPTTTTTTTATAAAAAAAETITNDGRTITTQKDAATEKDRNDDNPSTQATNAVADNKSTEQPQQCQQAGVTESPIITGKEEGIVTDTTTVTREAETAGPQAVEDDTKTTSNNLAPLSTDTADPKVSSDTTTITTAPTTNNEHAETTEQLRAALQQAHAELERLRSEQAQRMEDEGAILMELQSKLQEHMSAKAEAENKVRLAEQTIDGLRQTNQEQAAELEKYHEMAQSWDSQKTVKAEMEHDLRTAKKQITKMEEEKEAIREIVENLEQEVENLQRERLHQEEELKTLREQRDEQERREIALTNRLNAAKKKEADKANLAEHFEDEMKALRDDAAQAKQQVEELTAAKNNLEDEMARLKKNSEARVRQAELALADEKRLNEDRKGKMKAFIEKKSEELRQAKADSDSLQTELNQTSRSLVDLNNRWKQLHAQWVQSQTRNRELQRDLNRIKKDSENLHKVGDTLEMKLSRSATETEEHKNKRLAAKNELMTVLKTLEAEREVSARLRDAIKFTFTPKALSQQQLLKESLDDFESELLRLARRFGKPLPPVSGGGLEASERSLTNGIGMDEGSTEDDARASRADADIQRLIAKLDNETQGVSQHIMALSGEIERLHMLIDVSGGRNCYTTLTDIILGANNADSSANGGREGVAESSVPLRAIRSHQYGQVPNAAS